jgi:hypothetical protein
VECEHLGSKEIVSVFEALRDMDHLLSLILDYNIGSPNSGIIPDVVDLEPV